MTFVRIRFSYLFAVSLLVALASIYSCGGAPVRTPESSGGTSAASEAASQAAGDAAGGSEERLPMGIPYSSVADRGLIVRFNDGVKTASALEPHRGVSVVRSTRFDAPFDYELTLLRVNDGEDMGTAYERLAADPSVKHVWPNVIRTPSFVPDDPLYPSTETQTGQYFYEIVRAERAWSLITGSESVIVAVIDTGAQLDHDDLINQLWINEGEIPGNNLDDDDNDYYDDVHGYDFYEVDGDPTDDNPQTGWHGTSIAGLIGAQGNNSTGIMGAAGGNGATGQMGVRLMILRVGTDFSIKLFDELEAVAYAVIMGADIINLSFGGEPGGDIEKEVMDLAWLHGALLIAAGGNVGAGSSSTALDWPAAIDSVICVGATTPGDVRASYSKAGPQMELVAPGTNLITTTGENKYTPQVSGEFTGTSGATALVSGLAALLLSSSPGMTNAQLRERLQNTAVDLGPEGGDEEYGFGRIDFAAALGIKNAPASELEYDAENGVLRWNYVNYGDYNLDGKVGIPDITPIALNYLADATGEDPLLSWIDGDGSGQIGISDITIIALNYLNGVDSYRIYSSESETGPFAVAGSIAFADSVPGMPLLYETPPIGAERFFAFAVVDLLGNPGEMSDVVDTGG